MTTLLTATGDNHHLMTQAAEVLAITGDERYQPVRQSLQAGQLRQAQWAFLQVPYDASQAVSHFLTAFFLYCHGHTRQAKQEAARACQSRQCYRELRCFCEELQAASVLFRKNRSHEQPMATPVSDSDNNTDGNDASGKAQCCEGIGECCCEGIGEGCCEGLCDMIAGG